MKIQEHLSAVGNPIENSDKFMVILETRRELASYRLALLSVLQGYIASEQTVDTSLESEVLLRSFESADPSRGRFLINSEEALCLAALIKRGSATILDIEMERDAVNIAEGLRNEAEVRTILGDMADISPDDFNF